MHRKVARTRTEAAVGRFEHLRAGWRKDFFVSERRNLRKAREMTTLYHQNLDLTLYMRSSLLKDSSLDTFQRLLRQLAPRWASRLDLYRFRESYPSIDISVDGALQELALSKGLERGMLFDRLQELAASPKTSRRFGSLELRGANQELTVVLQFDDWVFQPVGTA